MVRAAGARLSRSSTAARVGCRGSPVTAWPVAAAEPDEANQASAHQCSPGDRAGLSVGDQSGRGLEGPHRIVGDPAEVPVDQQRAASLTQRPLHTWFTPKCRCGPVTLPVAPDK